MPASSPDPEDDRLYPRRPLIGIGVVVFRGDEVLLIRRGKPPRMGEWSLPGGAQEVGETVAEAAHREVREEAGVEIEVGELVAVVDSIHRDDDGRIRQHYTLVDLVAEWTSGDPVAGDDASDCSWVPVSDIPDYRLWSETERIIGLAHDRRRRGPSA